MLSGDNQRTATAVAVALGMDAEGHLMPVAKLSRISELKGEAPVLIVGDGVNDAPALAAACLGLAWAAGRMWQLRQLTSVCSRIGYQACLMRSAWPAARVRKSSSTSPSVLA